VTIIRDDTSLRQAAWCGFELSEFLGDRL